MNVISTVLLIMVGIAILGPDKLPRGLEFLWLNVTNFIRTQNDQPVLDMEEAREDWKSKDSPVFTIVMLLRAASEHLMEMRKRIFSILGAMAVFMVAAIAGYEYLLDWITIPAGDTMLVALRPTEMFMVTLKVVLMSALACSIPFIIYHLLRFIEPALETEHERKLYKTIVIWAIPFSGLFFLGGASFAYFVLLPFSLNYLGQFGGEFAQAQWNISEYISFVLSLLFWVAAAFETPLVMFILARADIVTLEQFKKARRWAYVGIAIMAAFITPTPDAINMLIVMGPLALLYELGVLLARIA
jgi:sec-independent protein translocase protein TatC